MGLVPDVQVWLGDIVKTIKGFRVYADNNEMLLKFLERSFIGLEFLLGRDPELTLSVREDRLLYGKEVVHLNQDRQDSLPFILYRNSFRRLVFVRGISREELSGLLRAISTDYSTLEFAGEDLVTCLWRLQLPHIRYLTIDALSRHYVGDGDEDRNEIERIQGDIENIVAAIYRTSATDDDLVAGVSISREDLEALREVRAEDPEDLDVLDHATERAITDVPETQLKLMQDDLQSETPEELSRRIMDILVQVLFRETSAQQSAQTIELIHQLFDGMLLARRYSDAIRLMRTLRWYAESAEDMQEMHVARHLLTMFGTEARVLPVLATLNEQNVSVSTSELFEFLRLLGPAISPFLLRALDQLTSPAHRRATCELIVGLGVPSLAELAALAQTTKWFVVRDILGLAQQYDLGEIGPLVAMGLSHDHPKVRQTAVSMLRGFGRGTADQALSSRLQDPDLDVRLSVYRVAAARRSREIVPSLEMILAGDKLGQRDPRELRLMMAAYAAIAGTGAVGLLDRLLNAGFFASLTNTEVQVAAAYALASIGTPATPALVRGSRTLNSRVREACKRALRRGGGAAGVRGQGPGDSPEVAASPREVTHPGLPRTGHLDEPTSELDPYIDYLASPADGHTDTLASAPPFRTNIPLSQEARYIPRPLAATPARSPLPRQTVASTHTDELPANLPPAPTEDLPNPSGQQVPMSGRLNVLGTNSVDIVPNELPPPEQFGTDPGPLAEPPPVVGSQPRLDGFVATNEVFTEMQRSEPITPGQLSEPLAIRGAIPPTPGSAGSPFPVGEPPWASQSDPSAPTAASPESSPPTEEQEPMPMTEPLGAAPITLPSQAEAGLAVAELPPWEGPPAPSPQLREAPPLAASASPWSHDDSEDPTHPHAPAIVVSEPPESASVAPEKAPPMPPDARSKPPAAVPISEMPSRSSSDRPPSEHRRAKEEAPVPLISDDGPMSLVDYDEPNPLFDRDVPLPSVGPAARHITSMDHSPPSAFEGSSVASSWAPSTSDGPDLRELPEMPRARTLRQSDDLSLAGVSLPPGGAQALADAGAADAQHSDPEPAARPVLGRSEPLAGSPDRSEPQGGVRAPAAPASSPKSISWSDEIPDPDREETSISTPTPDDLRRGLAQSVDLPGVPRPSGPPPVGAGGSAAPFSSGRSSSTVARPPPPPADRPAGDPTADSTVERIRRANPVLAEFDPELFANPPPRMPPPAKPRPDATASGATTAAAPSSPHSSSTPAEALEWGRAEPPPRYPPPRRSSPGPSMTEDLQLMEDVPDREGGSDQ